MQQRQGFLACQQTPRETKTYSAGHRAQQHSTRDERSRRRPCLRNVWYPGSTSAVSPPASLPAKYRISPPLHPDVSNAVRPRDLVLMRHPVHAPKYSSALVFLYSHPLYAPHVPPVPHHPSQQLLLGPVGPVLVAIRHAFTQTVPWRGNWCENKIRATK